MGWEVERGDTLLYYCDVDITIEDDDRGWTYNVEGYEAQSLEEAMEHAEGLAELDPDRERISDMLAKLSRDGVEEICRRLTSVEGPDLGEEYSPAWLEGQIRDRFFGIKQDLEETTSLEDVADRSPAGAVCLGSFFQTT